MGYKMKPNKSVMSRFKVSKTGKIKRHHAKTSHLMSARPAKMRRRLRQSARLSETLAGNMRKLIGVSAKRPARTEHYRKLAMAGKLEKEGVEGAEGETAGKTAAQAAKK